VVNPDPVLLEHAEKPAGQSISGSKSKRSQPRFARQLLQMDCSHL